jgi:hypothetical protein
MLKHRFESKKKRHLRELNNKRCNRYYHNHKSVYAREKAEYEKEQEEKRQFKEKTKTELLELFGLVVADYKKREELEKDLEKGML